MCSSDLDLGTANTLVYVRGHGIVLNEPSIVAMKDGTVLAAGHEAKAMLGRAPGSISVVRPLRHGVIADFDSTEKMLHYFIGKTRQRKTLVHPRVVVTVPSGITQVEKRAVRQSARRRGIATALLEEAEVETRAAGGNRLVLHAQTYARELYESAGYRPRGREFWEAGIEHIAMEKVL